MVPGTLGQPEMARPKGAKSKIATYHRGSVVTRKQRHSDLCIQGQRTFSAMHLNLARLYIIGQSGGQNVQLP